MELRRAGPRARVEWSASRIRVMDADRRVETSGGEARWALCAGLGERAVGADGWLLGHELHERQLVAAVQLDADGYACAADRQRLVDGAIATRCSSRHVHAWRWARRWMWSTSGRR